MLAAAQITIRDENDVVIASAVPASPVVDMLWLDTSVTPNALKRWNGNAWVDCGVADDLATEVTNRESAITQLSDLIDLCVIKGELETYLRLIEAGVQIGKSNSPYNVLIDDDSVDIIQSGVTIATFAFNKLWTKAAEVDSYVKIGGATLEWSATTGFSLDV